ARGLRCTVISSFLLLVPRPASSPLVPYTTLFRSWPAILAGMRVSTQMLMGIAAIAAYAKGPGLGNLVFSGLSQLGGANALNMARSEEHTSELQSRENLVCRLLLEKKKQNTAARLT